MKKIELLAPAGNKEALIAAVEAGCDAVYIGGKSFGARAFSKNFDDEEIIFAIDYCHLYGVKVYVTVNTLIYEKEVENFMEYIDFLHRNNVDAIIIQDLGMLDLVRKTYPNLEIHSSTQMHIHNLDGVKVMEKLGVKRVVLARETSIEEIRNIKNNSNIELEIFVHGALCVSYSGQCLMSSLIGGRSANRGSCAGSCRLNYDVIDDNDTILNKNKYPISMKDLNTLEYIGDLISSGVSSLKIEGRMKSKEYVYMVVKLYREAIDSYYKNKKVIINEDNLLKLKKIFNREYTRGFIFNEDNRNIINDYRPNHIGVKIGIVEKYKDGIATIRLIDTLTIGCGLRVIQKNDVGINVNEFYKDGKLVKQAYKGDLITIKVRDELKPLSDVVITLDSELNTEIDNIIKMSSRKVSIDVKLTLNEDKRINLYATDGINDVDIIGCTVEKAINKETTKEEISTKLNKLGDSIYKINNLDINIPNDIFIPLKEINDLRRRMVSLLNKKRLYKIPYIKEEYSIELNDFKKEKLLSILVDKNNYDKISDKYDVVYSYNDMPNTIYKLPRVIKEYPKTNKELLVGEIGAFNNYNDVCTDFSFNVVNSYTVAFLHSIGAKRITLSYELDDDSIKELIDAYHNRYNKHPNLELIVYGKEEVMISKYNLYDLYNKNSLYLVDRFKNKYKIVTRDNIMYIYNYTIRDKYDDKYYQMGINSLRYNFDS